MSKLLFLLLLAAIAVVLKNEEPEIRRYLKIRSL